MSQAVKNRLRKDLLMIAGMGLLLAGAFIAFSFIDSDGTILQSWSGSFYDFLLRR